MSDDLRRLRVLEPDSWCFSDADDLLDAAPYEDPGVSSVLASLITHGRHDELDEVAAELNGVPSKTLELTTASEKFIEAVATTH